MCHIDQRGVKDPYPQSQKKNLDSVHLALLDYMLIFRVFEEGIKSFYNYYLAVDLLVTLCVLTLKYWGHIPVQVNCYLVFP